jgi:hypothetical protein
MVQSPNYPDGEIYSARTGRGGAGEKRTKRGVDYEKIQEMIDQKVLETLEEYI